MFKGKLPIQPQFFYSHNDVIKKIFRNQNRNEKVMMILRHHFFVRCFCIQVYRIAGVATAAGAEALLKPQERDTC